MALTAGPRSIQSGNEYNHLFSQPTFKDPIVNRDGSIDDTLVQMAKIAQSGAAQVAQLAIMLAGADTTESCKNVHDFVVKNIQYALDKSGVEQLRTPNRTWHDRKSGVDCDCMSIFASALLRNMGIPHYFRVVAFGSNDFEHVYVVVPRNGNSLSGGKITLDGVIHQFDHEKPFTKHQDYNMSGSKLQMLNGIPMQVLNGTGGNHDYMQHESVEYNEKLRAFLIAQREMINTNRTAVQNINPQLAIENINIALSNWNNAHSRLIAVQDLARKEAQYHMGSTLFRSILAFFEGKASCSQVCAAGYVQLPTEKIMQIQNNSLSGLAGTDYLNMIGIDRWNIEHIAFATARGAFLLLMRLNIFGWAEKMAPAFFPVNYAGEIGESSWFYGKGNLENQLGTIKNINYNQVYTHIFGLTAAQHLTARKKMFDYVLRRWFNLGGDWDELKTIILKGAHKMLVKARPLPGYQFWCRYEDKHFKAIGSAGPNDKTPNWSELSLSGVSGLGEVAAAAIITAAAAVIAALSPFVASFTKPSGATIDPNTGPAIPTNPTTNPDPTGHPNAALNPSTGLWTDTQKNQYYNPLTGQWESNTPTSNTKKIILYVLALAGIGYGIYSLIPEDKPQKQIANGK